MGSKQIVIVVVSLIVGAAAMWGYQKATQPEEVFPDNVMNDIFDQDFFRHSRDPFKEMDRIQKEMDRFLGQDNFSSGFDAWFGQRYGDLPVSSIDMDEDDNFIYYRIDTNDLEVKSADVNVDNDTVAISVELTSRTPESETVSSLSQRFPVPVAVDPNSVRLDIEEGEIVVRFTKSGKD